MDNNQMLTPGCSDKAVSMLAGRYALRGLIDERGAFDETKRLQRAWTVYKRWYAFTKTLPNVSSGWSCGFYEWLMRPADLAMLFEKGDIVIMGDEWNVVHGYGNSGTQTCHHVEVDRDGEKATFIRDTGPRTVDRIILKNAFGTFCEVSVLNVKPAMVPQEALELLCERAQKCPMMRGDTQ